MHSCPRCGRDCECSGDIDDFDVMEPEWVYKNCQCDCEEPTATPDDDDSDSYAGEDIIGFYCIGCGHEQPIDGECNACTGHSVAPIYL